VLHNIRIYKNSIQCIKIIFCHFSQNHSICFYWGIMISKCFIKLFDVISEYLLNFFDTTLFPNFRPKRSVAVKC
jgi:hypothetical protein